MSRLDTEHTESNLLNVEVDMTPTFALTPYCHYCYEEKCNTEGHMSIRCKAWFCRNTCYMLYVHENKIVDYSPAIVKELVELRKKYIHPLIVNNRRHKLRL